MSKFIFIFLFFLSVFSSHAQNLKKILKEADGLYEDRIYRTAALRYLDALQIDPNDPSTNYKMGVCQLHSANKTKALPYLEKAYKASPDLDPEIQYHLAKAFHYCSKFKEARKMYEAYAKANTQDPEVTEAITKNLLECKYGEELLAHPVSAKIINLGKEINSKYDDYVPVIKADESEMVFTSQREGTTGGGKNENFDSFYEDIYISYQINDKWTSAKNIGGPVNTDMEDASIGLSPDGGKLYIYRDDNNGDIFFSKLNGVVWSKPQPVKEINTKYSELHCSSTPDGNELYFSSNRPGGFGGFDIYRIAKNEKGRWQEPQNLGPKINTKYDEDAPFIHPDGTTLYFSSQGHTSMGRYDIFLTHLVNGTWKEPENMGYPINSPDDDIYFVLSANNRTGYFSSAKEDTYGEKDLYKIIMPREELNTVVATKSLAIAQAPTINPITVLKGTVRDALTKQPLEANIELTDNSKNLLISEMQSNGTSGKYLIVLSSGKNYGISVEKPGYMFHSENFDIPISTNYQEKVVDIELKKISVGTKIILKNIFFDFDKATLRKESTAELERLYTIMVQSTIVIQISGHTDNKGSAEYNKSLSEKRAKAVVDYLVTKGIPASRMKFSGFGADKPIAPNAKPDGSDNPDGRQLNRRTEFEILSDK
jgi:outer membrane protein OmpA-like peptidoglycan-associated protein/tetratricopeptide (TPR) repeat protein